MAIRFLKYMEDGHPTTERRMLFGCDSSADVEDLPTEGGYTLPDGSTTAPIAPWSYALVAGTGVYVLKNGGTWEAI